MEPSFLVLTDLSPRSQRAVYLTALLAAAANGQVILLHMENMPMLEPELGLVTIPEQYYRQEHRSTLDALAALARHLPAPAIVESEAGNLHDVLGELISRWQPQLLVMGLAAEHDVLDEMLMNQALPALRQTGLPLLLIPDETDVAQDPVLPLPRLVAVAADGEAFQLADSALAFRSVMESWLAQYSIVHIVTPHDPSDGGISQAEAAVRQSGLLPAEVKCTTYQIRSQPRSKGIVQAALDIQADMVVILARPRTLLSSIFNLGVSAEVVRISPVPVLLLPTTDHPKFPPE